MTSNDWLTQLEQLSGCSWPSITKAAAESAKTHDMIVQALQPQRFGNSEVGLVVFGSLARGERTSGSDVDWTLLIDGQAAPEHRELAHEVSTLLKDLKLKEPNPDGAFGDLTFSHELVHMIGGDADSNRNLTQRMLLLLESQCLVGEDVRSRVVRNVLQRYLEDDQWDLTQSGHKGRIPRFLLNDIVRYWRTMAVDYASKRWQRANRGWALRNVKLRMSRKLLFASGLLLCFAPCAFAKHEQFASAPNLESEILSLVDLRPLELVAMGLVITGQAGPARKIMGSYDAFLACLDSTEKRTELEKLPFEKAESNAAFQEMRSVSHDFQDGLDELIACLEPQKLVRTYAIF